MNTLEDRVAAFAVIACVTTGVIALAVGGGFAKHGHPVAGLVVAVVGVGFTALALMRMRRRR